MSRVSKNFKYDLNHPCPIFIVPEALPGEYFEMITDKAAPNILPYYAISNYGRIWHVYENHFMSTSWDGPGYRIAVLRHKDGRAHTLRVHRLLMLTFRYFEGCEDMDVNHIDGCKTRNYIDFPGIPNPDNLEWTTHQENMIHAHKTGLKRAKFGEEHHNSKLTIEIVNKICELISNKNLTCRQIAEITGTQIHDIENIRYHKTWRHISKDYNF